MTRVFTFIFVLMLSGYQTAYALELAELLQNISSTPEKFALFTEAKMAYFLEKPLISKGYMEFKSPSTMIKRMTEPEMMEQTIEGDVLSIYQGEQRRKTQSLSANSKLALGINAVRWVLSGDHEMLETNFQAIVNGDLNSWTIQLSPKDLELKEKIKLMLITGADQNIQQILIEQPNGNSIKTDLYEHR